MAMPSQVCLGGSMRERSRIWSDDRGHLGGSSGKPFRHYHNEPRESIVISINAAVFLTISP